MQPLEPLILPLHGTRLIEASAGTGKTFTLALLFLRLLLERGLAVDQILERQGIAGADPLHQVRLVPAAASRLGRRRRQRPRPCRPLAAHRPGLRLLRAPGASRRDPTLSHG